MSSTDIKPYVAPSDSTERSASPQDEYIPGPVPTPPHAKRYRAITSSTTPSPRKGKKGRPAGTDGVQGDRKMGSWTKAEVRALWEALDLLPTKVKWDEIAVKVPGRDKLSCSNKWRYDIAPKLQAFINSLGDQVPVYEDPGSRNA